MVFRLPLSSSEDCLELEFRTTVGYVEHLVEQLTGERQPVHPCLLLEFDFNTIGPRLGVYIDGTNYDRIAIGSLGTRRDDSTISNTEVKIVLEIDDPQAIELQRLYSSWSSEPPKPWTTTMPKQYIEPFIQRATDAVEQIERASYTQIHGLDCPHCNSRHRRSEIRKEVEGRLMPPDIQKAESFSVDSARIGITGKCPESGQELQFD